MRTRDLSARSAACAVACVAAAFIAPGLKLAAQLPDLDGLLALVGERVREFYQRAHSVVCTEIVTLQPIKTDLMPDGFARVLEYDLRVEWDPSDSGGDPPEARMTRDLRKVNGRAPRPKDEPGCTDPASTAPDPLTMLLPHHRTEFTFSWKGAGRLKKREVLMLDYRLREAGPLEENWDKDKDCVHLTLPVRTRGRIWIDATTNDVMRLDESLVSFYEYRLPPDHVKGGRMYWEYRRLDTSVRYRPVAFQDPEETLLLPESMETVIVVEGAQSYRKSQAFSNYRRFLTAGRIVK